MDERPTHRPGESGPEKPGVEPEIIPPDRNFRPSGRRDARIWISFGRNRFDRLYITKPGPLIVILASLVLGLVVLATLVVLLGAFLIWLPVTLLVAAALILSGIVRGYFRRFG
jgi:hypothetical protein